MTKKILQRVLLAVGIIALLVVLVDIGISIAATMPGGTPVRVVHVSAGPYPLTVNLYKYPASAGYALPFAVLPDQATGGPLTIQAFSLPGQGVDATTIRATISPDPLVRNAIQGAAEITVRGDWILQIKVNGPAGQGIASVPITATALPAVPTWLGWLVGFVPFYVLALFFALQPARPRKTELAVVG